LKKVLGKHEWGVLNFLEYCQKKHFWKTTICIYIKNFKCKGTFFDSPDCFLPSEPEDAFTESLAQSVRDLWLDLQQPRSWLLWALKGFVVPIH